MWQECDANSADGSCDAADGDGAAVNVPGPDKGKSRRVVQFECVDKEEQCKIWAKTGECEANPGYMLSKLIQNQPFFFLVIGFCLCTFGFRLTPMHV